MGASPGGPKKRRSEDLLQQVYATASRLGIDQAGADKTIARAGGLREALRRLLERERRAQAGILKRVEREDLEQEAERRREIYQREREVFDRDRRSQRQQQTLGQRLDQALIALNAMSTAPAMQIQQSVSHSKPGDQAPPPAPQVDIEPNLKVICHHIEEIEHELDVARGVARPKTWRLMTNEQRDQMIVNQFAGVHKDVLARDCPELGSVQRIERVRRKHGLRAVDGLPREPNGGEIAA